jgi:hypothetical protein
MITPSRLLQYYVVLGRIGKLFEIANNAFMFITFKST